MKNIKLKICGMKYEDNMSAVSKLQPDYLGFIFYNKSSRYFDTIIPKISKSIKKTGVFVNASVKNIVEKVYRYDLHAVQLHGDESVEMIQFLKESLIDSEKNSTEIIKVFSIKDSFDFDVLGAYETHVDYFLFDTKGKLPGGNGVTFNWEVLKQYPSEKPFFLSGGIGLETITKLNDFMKSDASKYCYAIDVNSKFEIVPGLKDIEQLKTFKENLEKY